MNGREFALLEPHARKRIENRFDGRAARQQGVHAPLAREQLRGLR
jgi:hypothetical protein